MATDFQVLDTLNADSDRTNTWYYGEYLVADCKLKFSLGHGTLRITDIAPAMQPGKVCRQATLRVWQDNAAVQNILFYHYKGDLVRLFEDALKQAPKDQRNPTIAFCGYQVEVYAGQQEAKRVWSPWAKVNPLKEAPTKWTLPHVVRALLSGQYTECRSKGQYTDDYAYDAATNYGVGEADALHLARKIIDSPSGWWVMAEGNKIGVSCHHFSNYEFTFCLEAPKASEPAPVAPVAEQPAPVQEVVTPEPVAEPVQELVAEPAQKVVAEASAPAPVQVGDMVTYHIAGRQLANGFRIDTTQYALEVNAAGDVRTEKDGWRPAGSFTHRTPQARSQRQPTAQDWSIFAAGRSWYIHCRPFKKEPATLTERQERNGALRARRELERTERDNAARLAAHQAAGPLVAMLYGDAQLVQPRYSTAEEANAHALSLREDFTVSRRQYDAKLIRQIRAELATLDAHTLNAYARHWDRRNGGQGLVYLLSFLRDVGCARDRREALEHYPKPAPVQEVVALEPVAGQSSPAAPGWQVISRPVAVAPAHAAQLAQLRDLVRRLDVAGERPTLYQVVALAKHVPAGSPYHVESRPDGLAVVYNAPPQHVEVLRLAPAGPWPPAITYQQPPKPAPWPAASTPAPPRARSGRELLPFLFRFLPEAQPKK